MAFDLVSGKGKLNGLFESTDPSKSKKKVINIKLEHLHYYENQPFKLYEGQRLIDMVESIKDVGVLHPLTVRPIFDANGKQHETDYEILAGRNRHNASKLAGREDVPCIVEEGLSEEQAHTMVLTSNLFQRSFTDMPHSERAGAIAAYVNSNRQQGKRTDLIKEIDEIMASSDKAHGNRQNVTSAQNVQKIDDLDAVDSVAAVDAVDAVPKIEVRDAAGEKYSLNRMKITRYLQLDKLLHEMKLMVDTGEMPFGAGCDLSFLSEVHQAEVHNYLIENEVKITGKKAEAMKKLSQSGKFTTKAMVDVFEGKKKPAKQRPKSNITLKRKNLDGFFTGGETEEEIQDTIVKALSFYYANLGNLAGLEGVDEDKVLNGKINEVNLDDADDAGAGDTDDAGADNTGVGSTNQNKGNAGKPNEVIKANNDNPLLLEDDERGAGVSSLTASSW